jgi:hypothetical protein
MGYVGLANGVNERIGILRERGRRDASGPS